MDKRSISVTTFKEAEEDDRRYWSSKSPSERDARYLVIGGFAVAFHGFPRARSSPAKVGIPRQAVSRLQELAHLVAAQQH